MDRRILAGLGALACVAALAGAPAGLSEPPVAAYEVEIRNLTDGQPLTPPIIATHRTSTGMFSVGDRASFALKEIAENGNLAPMIAGLTADKHVLDWETGGTPLVPADLPGSGMGPEAVELTVTAAAGAKFLSFASMLICTNDGFTGLDSFRLPNEVGERVTVATAGYDAGTERNTEDYADAVPPCQGLHGVNVEPGTGASNPALAEGGVIRHHPGIQGGVDLTLAMHAWSDPVAVVTVERVS